MHVFLYLILLSMFMFLHMLMLLSVPQRMLVCILEKFMQKGPPAPANTIAYSLATTEWILFKFGKSVQ